MANSIDLSFCVDDWEHSPVLWADEICRRLADAFPETEIDSARGDTHIRNGLAELKKAQAPHPILKSHESYLGKVLHVRIERQAWSPVTVTGFIYPMDPPLGDTTCLQILGCMDDVTRDRIIQDLENSLSMVLASKVPPPPELEGYKDNGSP